VTESRPLGTSTLGILLTFPRVQSPMRLVLLLLLVSVCLGQNARYLAGIQQRWDASDLVCIGNATEPVRTGVVEKFDGDDRDQLSADVTVETCLKGTTAEVSGTRSALRAADASIHVLGDSVVALKDVGPTYAYGGPPIGFLNPGRNLLFLRRTTDPGTFIVTVPVYSTAIPLADTAPPDAGSEHDARARITGELEAAILQLDRDDQSIAGQSDVSYIGYLIDYLGSAPAARELRRFAATADSATRGDVAVALFDRGHTEEEPAVISVLLDTATDFWRRENAALGLGQYGTAAALEPLREVAAEPASTDILQELREDVTSSLKRLQSRLQTAF